MRLDLPVRPRRAAIGLTPLIDVVFILLLFFLLATRFSHYGQIGLSVPAADGAAPMAGARLVQLGADGGVALDGVPMALAQLTDTLRNARAAQPDLAVTLVADDAATLQPLVDLLAALRAAGISQPRLQ